MSNFFECDRPDGLALLNLSSIIKCQAIWRGCITRKRLKDLRSMYSKIFMDIEETTTLNVYWNSSLHSMVHPQFLSKLQLEKKRVENPKIDMNCLSQKMTSNANQKDVCYDLKSNCEQDYSHRKSELLINICEKHVHSYTEQRTTNNMHHQSLSSQKLDNSSENGEKPVANIPQCNEFLKEITTQNSSAVSGNPVNVINTDSVKIADIHESGNIVDIPESGSQESGNIAARHESEPLFTGERSELQCQQTTCWETQIDPDRSDLKSLSKEELQKHRSTIAMELLWVQQALESRKQYLKMKSQMSG